MNAAEQLTRFSFVVGEEVVVRLGRADIFDTERGVQVPLDYRPSWTIGAIIDRVYDHGRCAYVLGVRLGGDRYVCVVTEDCIEGVA